MSRTTTVLRFALVAGALVALSLTGRAQPPFPGKVAPIPVLTALVPYVGDEGVQKELKLTEDQTKKLIAARQKQWDDVWNTAPRDTDPEARNKALETAFKDALSAEQLKRANQLATQILWGNRGGFGGTGFGGGGGPGGGPGFAPSAALPAPDLRRAPAFVLAQYAPIADALQLDDTQKKLASGAQFGRGGRFAAIVFLTPDQSATAKDLLGEPYKGVLQPQSDPRNAGGPFGGPGPFGMPALLQYTNAPDVQKELELNEDQLRGLVDLRLKLGQPGADIFTLSPADRKKADDERRAELDKALDKLLTAKQMKRLKQIERQQIAPDSPFFAQSELSKELAVTADQRKKYEDVQATYSDAVVKAVLSGEPIEKVQAAVEAAGKDREAAVDALLTADQRAKKKEMLGEPFKGNVFAGGPGGGFGANQRKFTFGRYFDQFNLLTAYKGVQEELKLKEDQIKKFGELRTEFNTKFPFQDMLQALRDEKNGDKHFADRSEFIEKALADVLTKEQQARFRELQLQQLEAPQAPIAPGGGPFGRFYTTAASYPGVAEEIKLTADQKKKLLDGSKPPDVLTADQKKAIDGMLGKKADLAVVFAPPQFPVGPGTPAGLPVLSPERQLLLNTAVWDGLKLDKDQIKKLVPAANEYTLANPRRGGAGPGGGFGGPPVDPKSVKEAIEAFEKATDDILTADQKKRLDQLAVQQGLATGLDTALTTSRVPALTKALAPTDDQKKAVSALATKFHALAGVLDRVDIDFTKENDARRKLRDQLDAVVMMELTADQKSKLKELTGEPFEGFPKQPLFNRGFGGGGGFGGPGFGPFGP